MRLPVQRSRVVCLVESEAGSASSLKLADCMLGAGGQERVQVVACSGANRRSGPVEPCMGDELAAVLHRGSQAAAASSNQFHGSLLQGRRGVTGLCDTSGEGVARQLVLLGGDLLIAARGSLLTGAALSEIIGRAQQPACVASGSFAGTIGKLGVAVDFAEGSSELVERALMLASQLGVALHPVHVASGEVAGDRRGGSGSELKRFDQLMGQVDLPFGAAYATRNLLQPLEVVRGDVVEAIDGWASAAGVDLVVVGSGSSGRARLQLGSVAQAMVSASAVSVWVEQL